MTHVTRAELYYTFPEGQSDDPRAWATEDRYFRGLGEDGGESVIMMTPSGAPAASQAASQASSRPWYETLAQSVQSVLPVAANVYANKKFTDLNIERARMGLSPLSAQQYATAYQVPLASLQVGPDQQAQRLLMYGAIAVGGLVLLRALKVI